MRNFILIVLILLVGGALFFLVTRSGVLNKTPARLEILTTPSSRVFLGGEDVGSTPYDNKALAPGTYTIRLVPEDSSLGFPPHETTLILGKGDAAVINHNFAGSGPDSSGYTLELKKDVSDKALISIVTDPDTANVTLDSVPQGYSPLSKIETTPGNHSLLLSSPGYKSLEISVNTVTGHNLIVKAKLAVDLIILDSAPQATDSASIAPAASASPSASPIVEVSRPYVLIGETGTGWLRVRQDPTASGEELGTTDVGTKLPYLGESTDDGWHKVEFMGDTGWVSGRYTTVVK